MAKLPNRRTPAHFPPQIRINRPTIVFVTVCTQSKKRILAKPDVHALLREAWREADGGLVGRYVVMPDHIHLFCAPSALDCVSLAKWVQFWKSWMSRRWPRPAEQPVWQKSFWDTQLRRGESYSEKWEYVRQNPVRAGLVTNPDDWPYTGEVNVLPWW